jgi:hypothetical protein
MGCGTASIRYRYPTATASLEFPVASPCPRLPDGGHELRRVVGLSLHARTLGLAVTRVVRPSTTARGIEPRRCCTAIRPSGRFDLRLPRRHLPHPSARVVPRLFPADAFHGLLSWGSSKMPLHRHHQGSPLPDRPSPVLRRIACQALRTFRPCRSTRLRRFPPPVASQVYCTLQPIMGFAVFRSRVYSKLYATVARSPLRRMPFEAFPPHHSRGASPRPIALPPLLPVHVVSDASVHPTSGPCSVCEAVANALPLPGECCTLLPWASRSVVCLVRHPATQSKSAGSQRSARRALGTSRSPR